MPDQSPDLPSPSTSSTKESAGLVDPSHPNLWRNASPIMDLASVRPTIEELQRLVVELNGAALAAPQIGVGVRLFVWRNGAAAINPHWAGDPDGGWTSKAEGCLTWPGQTVFVKRFNRIKAMWTDARGAEITRSMEGQEARVFQHECDHLNGICIFPKPAPSSSSGEGATLEGGGARVNPHDRQQDDSGHLTEGRKGPIPAAPQGASAKSRTA